MPHVTCAFSNLGVQNVIPNGCWSVTVKEAERMEGPQKTEQHLKFSAQYGCHDELMQLLINLAFMWQLCFYGDLDYEQPLFHLVQCCVTHQTTQRKKLYPIIFLSWHAQQTERIFLILWRFCTLWSESDLWDDVAQIHLPCFVL